MGESLSLAVSQDQCGRVALLGSNTGSMWASRSPWQYHRINVGESLSLAAIQDQCGRVAHTPIQYRINVGESPSLRFNTGSMWASRPHSYSMAQTTLRALAAHTRLGPPRNLPRGGSTGWTQIAEPRCAYAGCATPR